ncbi:MAG: sugar kinase [Candidatus Xiphinematobacter sp.]|nr:MAG: sugar kinase [Candidatus Xiphinematobacter sp.]
MPPVLVIGSVAMDHVKTPYQERQKLLGGSASYSTIAASFFSPVRLVGVVGEDFPEEYWSLLASRSVGLDGLQVAKGKTFQWSAVYHTNMDGRTTISTRLNVLQDFSPTLPRVYQTTPYVLLANVSPKLQKYTLGQVQSPLFVAANTMDFWIKEARKTLLSLLRYVDMLILNEHEARELTGVTDLVRAGNLILELGPEFVVLSKGEHGALLLGKNSLFSCPAYPLGAVRDPTGAGDSFAGGMVGYLANACNEKNSSGITFEKLRLAVI